MRFLNVGTMSLSSKEDVDDELMTCHFYDLMIKKMNQSDDDGIGNQADQRSRYVTSIKKCFKISEKFKLDSEPDDEVLRRSIRKEMLDCRSTDSNLPIKTCLASVHKKQS